MESPSRWRFHLFLTASSLSGLSYLFMFKKSSFSWIREWFRWCPTSIKHLEKAEMKMFSYLEAEYELNFIPIILNGKNENKIRFLTINKAAQDKSTPLVLLHGFASGIGLWILNLSSLSKDRTVCAPDILGFGHSSRPKFSKDAEMAENELIDSIEEWRKEVGIEKFVLLGHSMGGFLAASYAIKYPDHVKSLILADPWGFPVSDITARKVEIPFWIKIIAMMLRPFNPLAGLRAAGPWGPKLVKRLRPDILKKFESIVKDLDDVSSYIYHCNAQNPSGESAFKAMTAQFGWAVRPMINRISDLRQDIPITFIYGARSWIDSTSGLQTSAIRENSFVEIKLIQGAGHHVYADDAEVFNSMVCNICENVDQNGQLFIPVKLNPVDNTTPLNSSDENELYVAEVT